MDKHIAALEELAEDLREWGDGAALRGFADRLTAAIALMRGQSEQCDATVEDAGYPSNPHQCSRKAVAGSPYCAQHRKMYAPRPTEGPSR